MGNVLIKKYSNRKLYDTLSKKFITLKDIAKMLNEGKNIKVVEKSTGEDITTHVIGALLQKHYDHGKILLNIPDESPLELIKSKVRMLKVKRSLRVMYQLVQLNSTNKKALDKIVDELLENGIINKEMAIEAGQTLWNLLRERDKEIEHKMAEKLKANQDKCEKLREENIRLKKEIEKLKKSQSKKV